MCEFKNMSLKMEEFILFPIWNGFNTLQEMFYKLGNMCFPKVKN